MLFDSDQRWDHPRKGTVLVSLLTAWSETSFSRVRHPHGDVNRDVLLVCVCVCVCARERERERERELSSKRLSKMRVCYR